MDCVDGLAGAPAEGNTRFEMRSPEGTTNLAQVTIVRVR